MLIGLGLIGVSAALICVLDWRPDRTNFMTGVFVVLAVYVALIGTAFVGYSLLDWVTAA